MLRVLYSYGTALKYVVCYTTERMRILGMERQDLDERYPCGMNGACAFGLRERMAVEGGVRAQGAGYTSSSCRKRGGLDYEKVYWVMSNGGVH